MPPFPHSRQEWLIWTYAAGAWGLALIGGLGFAWLLGLGLTDALLLLAAVGGIALFGSALPILRLGYRRLEKQKSQTSKGE